MASLFHLPKVSVFDASGDPLPGSMLYFYETESSTPKDTYADVDLNTANSNPVVADAYGTFSPIWLGDGLYRVTLTNSSGITQWTVDGVGAEALSASDVGAALYPLSAAETGAGIAEADLTINFPYGDIRRYGADTSGAVDSTTAITNALACNARVVFPSGTYLMTGVTVSDPVEIVGEGLPRIVVDTTGTGFAFNVSTVAPEQSKRAIIRGLAFDNGASTPASFIKIGTSGSGSLNTLIEDCQFSQCAATYCIDNYIGYGTTIRNCVFNDVTGSAIRLQGSAGEADGYSFAAMIDDCDITRPSVDGLLIEGTIALQVSSTIFQGCGGKAVVTKGVTNSAQAWNLSFDGVYWEANTGNDVDFSDCSSSYTVRANFKGCTFLSSPTIVLGTHSYVTFINCANSGGSEVTVSGSGESSVDLTSSLNFIQSGTFRWQDNTVAPLARTITWSGAGAQSLGVNVNSGETATAFLLLVTRQTGSGNNTGANLYLVRTGYDGDNYTATEITSDVGGMGGGSMTFTFSLASSVLHIAGPDAGNYAATLIQNL